MKHFHDYSILQADEKYQNAVEGLNPEKEKHEFYVDIAPDFGFPLAIRPKFQLNVVINRDPDGPTMRWGSQYDKYSVC